VAVGVEDIQIMLSIFIPIIVILIIPLVVYFHKNGIAFERLKVQIENLCHHVVEAEKDRERLDCVHTESEKIKGYCKSLDKRISLIEQNVFKDKSPMRTSNINSYRNNNRKRDEDGDDEF